MSPGNAKCSMTSLADTKHIFRERLKFRSWLRPRAVSRLRARFAALGIICNNDDTKNCMRNRPINKMKNNITNTLGSSVVLLFYCSSEKLAKFNNLNY